MASAVQQSRQGKAGLGQTLHDVMGNTQRGGNLLFLDLDQGEQTARRFLRAR